MPKVREVPGTNSPEAPHVERVSTRYLSSPDADEAAVRAHPNLLGKLGEYTIPSQFAAYMQEPSIDSDGRYQAAGIAESLDAAPMRQVPLGSLVEFPVSEQRQLGGEVTNVAAN